MLQSTTTPLPLGSTLALTHATFNLSHYLPVSRRIVSILFSDGFQAPDQRLSMSLLIITTVIIQLLEDGDGGSCLSAHLFIMEVLTS